MMMIGLMKEDSVCFDCGKNIGNKQGVQLEDTDYCMKCFGKNIKEIQKERKCKK